MRLAMERIALDLSSGPDSEQATEILGLIGSAVVERSRGKTIALSPRLASPLGVQLAHRLRAELVRGWLSSEEPPDALEAIRMMAVLEEVLQSAGSGTREHPAGWDRDFADRLSSPSGLELVVEVAHDLRSPLTSVLFLAETLQRGQSGPVNELQHRQLGLIYSAALGLSTLASNVMELARGGSRLADDQPAPFSVKDVFESVADIVRPMAEEKGLTIRLLPPSNDHRLGPAQALSRVLLNLTTNAIKFTEEGFVELVAKAKGLRTVEFSVRDTGHGINPEAVETLYQPFRRAPKGDGLTFSGTGLGLALCRKLVEVMGSELEYETGEEWGTRFYFEMELPPASSS